MTDSIPLRSLKPMNSRKTKSLRNRKSLRNSSPTRLSLTSNLPMHQAALLTRSSIRSIQEALMLKWISTMKSTKILRLFRAESTRTISQRSRSLHRNHSRERTSSIQTSTKQKPKSSAVLNLNVQESSSLRSLSLMRSLFPSLLQDLR